VNTEKPERDCKRWRSIFDRDRSKEQCGHTTICPEVVWGLLDGFCRDEEWATEDLHTEGTSTKTSGGTTLITIDNKINNS
jgi:hypothetical protein